MDYPTLRGWPGVFAGLLGALAVVVAIYPAHARHSAPRHASRASHDAHESRHESRPAPPYAAIVLDVNSGNVLHAASADELRHPASLTKIMTLYLLFEQLDAGRLRLDSALPVSDHASAQAPTKLGLKPGQSIQVEDAIRALVTKSANDAAVVVAEAIGGDEHEFAEMMTRKARALGMSRTIYRNASGLPSDEQVTTARDQALLGRAIQERFPRHYRYFATPSFTYNGQTMRNHNQLLGQVEGMDGIKTGYTEASGFNLVASVRRDNRHIVSVVLGGTSASARDARMRSLIEEYIVAAGPQKRPTAIATATAAKEAVPTRMAAAARAPEARNPPGPAVKATQATEARLADWPAAATTYSIASQGRPIPWPASFAPPPASAPGSAAPIADPAPTSAAAPTEAIPVPIARPAIDPIKPIQVKTIKVKLGLTQVAASASPPGASASGQVVEDGDRDRTPPATAAPQAAAPPQTKAEPSPAPAQRSSTLPATAPAAPQRPPEHDLIAEALRETALAQRSAAPPPRSGMPAVLLPREAALAAPRREPERDVIAEALRKPAPPQSAPHPATQPAAPLHSGWIIQVGAFDVEREARDKLSAVQAKAARILGSASPFTEAVVVGDKTLYRARFAGMQKDQAEAICRQLKRNDIACMTIKN